MAAERQPIDSKVPCPSTDVSKSVIGWADPFEGAEVRAE
jgi:hypothetical protein